MSTAIERKPVETTTVRVFKDDGVDLSDLAQLTGQPIADAYREHCAPFIRAKLIELAEARLERLRSTEAR